MTSIPDSHSPSLVNSLNNLSTGSVRSETGFIFLLEPIENELQVETIIYQGGKIQITYQVFDGYLALSDEETVPKYESR